ncbi:chlorophyll A-B binding protein [Aureococcus anophagefferens]|nr:chlorophyll A-B binding protein [Aureococcus anophagefferens]
MAKLALALLLAPAVAFQAPASQKASVVVKDSIGVDPGPIEPSGLFWEDKESLARRRVEIKHRISMMAFLGMMVQELGITFRARSTSTARRAAGEAEEAARELESQVRASLEAPEA